MITMAALNINYTSIKMIIDSIEIKLSKFKALNNAFLVEKKSCNDGASLAGASPSLDYLSATMQLTGKAQTPL
jgi:hypothetical protein